MGGGGDNTIVQNPFQIKLDKLNYEIKLDQVETWEALKPFLEKAAGVKIGNDGKYVKMSEEEYRATLTPTEQLAFDNSKAQQTRLSQALAGTLPVPDYVQRKSDTESARVDETLRRTLGEGWAGSSSGIQKKAEFEAANSMMLDAFRRDELSQGTGYAAVLQGLSDTQQQKTLNSGATLPYTSSGILQAGLTMSQDMYNRSLAQAQMNSQGGGGGAMQALGGAGAGAGIGFMIGGPMGAAVGGGIGMLAGLM